jgi:hypothetical protein
MPNYVDGTEFIRDLFRYGAVSRGLYVTNDVWQMMAESGRYLVDATEEDTKLVYVHPWGEFCIYKTDIDEPEEA